MKKLLMTFAVGLVIGLGGSTLAIRMLGGGDATLPEALAAATAEEAAADSAHAAGGDAEHAVDGAEHGEQHEGDEAARAAADSAAMMAAAERLADTIPVDPAGAGGGYVSAPVVAMSAAEGPGMEPARLAKLFASMQAREAARVLEHMDDYEVQVILTQLGNREAAAILSNLTPERAAVISRSVIRGERSSQ